jgi:alkaline phosphatase
VQTHPDAETIVLDAGLPGLPDSGLADAVVQADAANEDAAETFPDATVNDDAEAQLDAEPNGDATVDGGEAPADAGLPDVGQPMPKPIVILMIGDGMGPGQLEAASHFAHGQAGQLFMESLANEGEIETGSLTGITDSAASATAMATGVKTYNRMIGTDRNEVPVETILERAQRLGYGAGVVTTASLPHATPASFTAHVPERFEYLAIADDQARNVKPFVALGGGGLFYNRMGPDSQRTDNGLIDPLIQQGWQYVYTRDQMNAAQPATGQKLLGIFAPEHLEYVIDRPANTTQPTLTEMSLTALRFLDSYPQGFFLMIEGARIDMASHDNNLHRAVTETIAFDEAVAAVANWAAGRPDVQLIVTADHECGGLDVVTPNGQGNLPAVAWRWLLHTNSRIRIFGQGPLTQNLVGIHDHTYVYQLMRAHLFGEIFTPPPLVLTADGNLEDLRHTAVSQTAPTAFGTGINELNDLRLDADEYGLFIGVEGLFEWDQNSVVLLIDKDFGASTGAASMVGAVTDQTGRVDNILRHLPVTGPVAAGFGVEFAVVSWGGSDPKLDEVSDDGGLRALTPANNLPWLVAATNFGEGVRTRGGPTTSQANEGFEVYVPWDQIYPDLLGMVPVGGTVAIAAVLVNSDGGYLSNQALPPFAATQAANPGSTATALPGVVSFGIDQNGDGVGDGDAVPVVR